MPETTLTFDERAHLFALEAAIENGLELAREGWSIAARALIEVRNLRLYREYCDTFEAYVAARWQRTRQWAYQVMSAVEVSDDVSRGLQIDIPAPSAQRHLRELAKLPPERRADVWEEACRQTDNKPTARVIATVARVEPATDPEDHKQQATLGHILRMVASLNDDYRRRLINALQEGMNA